MQRRKTNSRGAARRARDEAVRERRALRALRSGRGKKLLRETGKDGHVRVRLVPLTEDLIAADLRERIARKGWRR